MTIYEEYGNVFFTVATNKQGWFICTLETSLSGLN